MWPGRRLSARITSHQAWKAATPTGNAGLSADASRAFYEAEEQSDEHLATGGMRPVSDPDALAKAHDRLIDAEWRYDEARIELVEALRELDGQSIQDGPTADYGDG